MALDGSSEWLEGTTIHPIWSEDRQDWVPLGELVVGEQLRAASGLATVLAIHLVHQPTPVYNLEVHGQHVYQVGNLALLVHNAYPGAARGVTVGKYNLTDTVANHLDDVVKRGPFKGEPARPFLNSPHLIDEIIAGGKAVLDEFVEGALRWDVPGSFRGSSGTWELVVDPKTNTILHWNFVR